MSLTLLVMIFLIACGALWIALFLTRPNHYPKVDLSQIDRKALRATGEQLLCEAETWPEELSAPGVSVASSCAAARSHCTAQTRKPRLAAPRSPLPRTWHP